MHKLLAPRTFFLMIFLVCSALMGYAYFAQYVQGYQPCLLCWVQRFFVLMVGLTALAAFLHSPKGTGYAVYGLIGAFFAAFGAFFAGRHVYIQNLPLDHLDGCSPSVQHFLDNSQYAGFLRNIFLKNMDCGKIDWVFLGHSMPRWVLLWFVVMCFALLWRGFTARAALNRSNLIR